MRVLQIVLMILFTALLLPAPRANASTVNPEPATITGTVNFPGFTTTSISVTAVGGGNTAQATSSGSSYHLPVAGGDWTYAVSASCGLRDAAGNTVTVSFSQRSVVVAPGETVTNDYDFSQAGFIRFVVDIVGDVPESWASAGAWATRAVAAGEKTASYSFGTTSNEWLLPVIPNPQVELTAKIDVFGASGEMQRFSFGTTATSPYKLLPVDVAPGAVVTVPLPIHFVDGGSPPPTYAYSGYLSGRISLLGLPSANLDRHNFVGKSLLTNPAIYTSNAINVPSGIQYIFTPGTLRTYFKGLDGTPLTWPPINGDSNNNKAIIYPNTTSYLDLERTGGFLSGSLNFSGSVDNEDLKAVTLLFNGVRDYDPVTKGWTHRDTYGGASTLSRDTATAKPPTLRNYDMFLPSGDWGVTTITLNKQLQSPLRSSSVTIRDHSIQYDGKDYFGSPLRIEPGDNQQDFNYCLGSAIFRFHDPAGRLLSSPQVTGGTGIHQSNGVTTLSMSAVSGTSTEANAVKPEVEVFGPPGQYTFPTVRVLPAGGVYTNYGPRNLSLSCNTTKVYDIPGPTLNITAPQAEIVTNAQPLPVSGRAYGYVGSAIAGVTVNDQSATLSPVAGGSANEVAFSHDLALDNGENLVSITATTVSGAQALEQLIVYVDRWQPAVSIVGLADGDFIPSTQIEVPLQVEAADRGYGYTFAVYLDGALIHSASDAGNTMAPAALRFNTVLNSLALGEHQITATASDKAGNSTSASITILVDDPPPVLYGLADQSIEATSAAGAAASFAVTATATCEADLSQGAFQAPVLTPQSNSTTTGNSVSKTFQWSAVTAPDGHAVQYLIQVSDSLDFATILYSSGWQAATTWSQSLPVGTWYWRVLARDSVHTAMQSAPAAGNSFSIIKEGTSTVKFSILNHSDCTLSGGVYPNAGPDIWVGPFDGSDVDRSFLMFDTSAIGSDVTIASARLLLDYQIRDYVQSDSVTEVRESNWELPGAYDGYVGAFLASQPISVSRPLGLVSFDIRPDYVAGTGITKFALKAGNEDFSALNNSAPGYKRATSQLEVTFAPNTVTWAEPTLTPQENAVSGGEWVDQTFHWGEVTAADGDPVEFLVEISGTPNFSTIDFSSPWQTSTAWTRSLPPGTWYWRVTARDAVHPAVTSNPAASSFTIAYQPPSAPPGQATVTCSENSGDIFPLGATTVTCVARDACDRSAAGSFTISVHDTLPPELSVPADLIVDASSAAGAPVEFTLLATDAVDPSPAVSCAPASGSTFPIGATVVTCTASDASGNRATETFQITVEDPRPPTLTVPGDRSVEATGPLTPVDIGQASATHILPFTIGNDAPESYPVGTTVVTWIATDSHGKTASAAQTIIVTDATAPVVTAPASLTVEATGALTPVDSGAATATDAVGVVSLVSDAPATFPLGVTTVTWTATDAAGNVGTAVQTVTVLDATAPVVTAPASLTVEATGALTPVDSGAASATDEIGVVSITSDAPAAFLVGVTTVTWTATDAAGNVGTAVQTVTVLDQTPPTLQGLADQNLEAASASGAAAVFTVTASDLVDPAPAVTCSATSGLFPLGQSTVTCTATDASGNSVGGSFTLTVRDTTAPALTVPDAITVVLNTPVSSPLVQDFLSGATAIDAVDTSVTVTASALAALDTVGTRPVTFTAIDGAGNQTARTATIRVVYGCGEEFMTPVSLLKPFKQGSTVPVKIGFCDASGAAVTSAVVRMALYPVSDEVPAEDPIEIESPGNGDTGNLFKVVDEAYQFNLSTRNLASGTYQVRATLNDGSIRTVPLSLK